MKFRKYLLLSLLSFSSCENSSIEERNFKEEIRKYCTAKNNQKSCIENINFVEGRGYCTVKYDENGCNKCTLQEKDHSMDWFCTFVHCVEKNEEQANKCIEYNQSLP